MAETHDIFSTALPWLKVSVCEGYDIPRRKDYTGPLVLVFADDTGKRSPYLRIEEIQLTIDALKRVVAWWEENKGPIRPWTALVGEVHDTQEDTPKIPPAEWIVASKGTPEDVQMFLDSYSHLMTSDQLLTASKMMANALKRVGRDTGVSTLVEPDWATVEQMPLGELYGFYKRNKDQLSPRNKKEVFDLIRLRKAEQASEVNDINVSA